MLIVRFGANREMSSCGRCGHAQTAHVGGCFCGCHRFEADAPEPAAEPLTPVHKLLDFMYEHLTSEEVDAVIASLARSKGVAFPGTLHDARQGFIIENFTWSETQRYLEEFRRRLRRGEPLVRPERIRGG